MTLDARTIEILASRICHDLISPVGAVNNGVEFLEDTGPEALEDALGLIKYSAAQASARLQIFRIVYGAGGRDPNIKPENIQRAFSGLISLDGKITQSWDPYGALGPIAGRIPEGFCKMLMGCLLLASECLPRGGNIGVRADDSCPGRTRIDAQGQDCTVRERAIEALAGSIPAEILNPHLVHPYMMGILAKSYGFGLSFGESTTGSVVLFLESPPPVAA